MGSRNKIDVVVPDTAQRLVRDLITAGYMGPTEVMYRAHEI